MSKKSVAVCVQKDLVQPITWALREFDDRLSIKFFDTTRLLGTALEKDPAVDVLILDSNFFNESTADFARTTKAEVPHMKILFIVSSGTTKEEIISIVQSKVVSGVLVRPFTAGQVSDYVRKLCSFEKAAEAPWYMQTGIK
jgi:DNA-binding NarL/FixJ family response regulator